VETPAVGDVVLVRSSAFQGECPAIVITAKQNYGRVLLSVRVFTDVEGGTHYLSSVLPQSESSNGWGWRTRGATVNTSNAAESDHPQVSPALSADEQLAHF
jgi:hypothetical protein